MRKKLIILQDGNKNCGACSLLSIIRYYGGDISLNRLCELTRTTKKGTSFFDLKMASSKIGFSSKAYSVDKVSDIPVIYLPCIAHLKCDGSTHFVVIYKIFKDKILLMDPACGKKYISVEEFKKLWTSYIMVFEPRGKIPIVKGKKYLNELLVSIISKNKKVIINIMCLSVLFVLFTFGYSYYMKVLIDKLVYNNKHMLFVVSLIFTVIALFKVLTNLFRNNVLAYLNMKVEMPMFINSFRMILLLPYSYYKNKTTGEMIARINDLSYVKNVMSKLLTTVFLDVILFLVSLIWLYFINSYMFFISLIIGLFYIIILTIYKIVIKDKIRLNQESSAEVNSMLVEAIEGCETAKNLHIEENLIKRFECSFGKLQFNALDYSLVNNITDFYQNIVSYLGIIVINYIGIINIINGNLTIGSLIIFNTILDYYLSPFKDIINLCSDYIYVFNAINRVNNIYEVDLEDSFNDNNLLSSNDIVIKDLDYSFNGRRSVLNGVNLEIDGGSKVLFLGSSGGGKSTLLKILYKYYDVARTKVFIGGYDINDITKGEIRNKLVYVSQNEVLYTGSIKDNIYVDRNILLKDVLDVYKLVEIDNIIKDNLLGYDMLLEENGTNISGGERQRIILARALLKNSDIIMIDEGLSQMDVELERRILSKMFCKYNNKTIIVVSHRANNMDLYDKVIKIDSGRIINIIDKEDSYADEVL